MLDVRHFKAQDLHGLSPEALAAVAEKMLAHIAEQSQHIGEQSLRIDAQAQAIKWRHAKIESITFQLARFKAWKFGARTEAMEAALRRAAAALGLTRDRCVGKNVAGLPLTAYAEFLKITG